MATKGDKYGRETDRPTTAELVQELGEESKGDKPFVPAGYCPKHYIKLSNGMFDAPCPLCESEMEEAAHRLSPSEEDIARRREEGEAICARCGYTLGTCPRCQGPNATGERYCPQCDWCEACGKAGRTRSGK